MPQITTQNTIQFLLGYSYTKLTFTDNLPPTTTLLQFLRSDHKHKGTKEGCNVGDCGACTIIIAEIQNNRIIYRACNACLIFLPQIHGKQVITIEHLSHHNHLHPVQNAMIEMGASQCGFCTPGFVMSLFGLYKNKQTITDEDIFETFAGNLCRCTGYQTIIDAAKAAFINKTDDHFDKNEPNTIAILNRITHQNRVIDTNNFKYYSPSNLNEALAIKSDIQNLTIIGGATDVSLRVTKAHENLTPILDLTSVSELDYIQSENKKIRIGSLTTLQVIKEKLQDVFPEFSALLTYFGATQIRNKSTLAGNIGSASPIGDTLPFLMAIDASIILQSSESKRVLKLREFITGYHQTSLQPNELITEVVFPLPGNNIVDTYKLSKRKDLDIATVSFAACVDLSTNNIVKKIDIYYGGMSAITKRASHLCDLLTGKTWTKDNVMLAKVELSKDFTPISDARATAEGRLIMAQNLFIKFWNEHH